MMPKKVLIILLAILGIAAYVAGSFWVIGIMQGKGTTVPFIPKQNTAATTTDLPQGPIATPTPKPTPTPMPTPTPLQGPGRYACDADGICGDFSDERRKSCPKTFADPHCLGMCAAQSVRCSQ